MVDHHCKELYRCYKCVLNDYESNYTSISYEVNLNEQNGIRELDCKVNSKQDAENVCECDKRFAANIAQAKEVYFGSRINLNIFRIAQTQNQRITFSGITVSIPILRQFLAEELLSQIRNARKNSTDMKRKTAAGFIQIGTLTTSILTNAAAQI